MRAAVVIAVAALGLAGCGDDSGQPPGTTPAASSTAATAELGTTHAFAKTSDGAEVGTVRFTDAVSFPADCVLDSSATNGTLLGLRVEYANTGTTALQSPSSLGLLKVNDVGGFTQDASTETIAIGCRGQYPPLADAPAPGKAAGWVLLRTQVTNPSALVFTASAWDGVITADKIPFAPVTPDHVVVKLPATLAAATPAPATTTDAPPPPTTTEAPAPTTTAARAVPRSGGSCDPSTDGWAKDPSGQQLYCTYAGGATPKWVNSKPLIGTRQVGAPCDGYDYVAQSPSGQPLMCTWDPVKQDGTNSWQPGP